MLTGLDILIARMKTNPEEFLIEDGLMPYQGGNFGGKWSDLLDYARRIANEEELQALEAAQKEFYRGDFNERVMKRLAGEEVKQEISPYITKGSSIGAAQSAMQNAAAQQQMMHQQMMRNSAQNAVLQGGHYDPNTHGYVTLTGGFQAAEIKQEGAPLVAWAKGLFGGR